MKRIAADDPDLGARLILMTLPATGRDVSYTLEVDGLGEHRVGDGEPEFRLSTDPRTLAELATRRKALKLRRMSTNGLVVAAVVDSNGAASNGLGDLEAAARS